MAKFERCYPIVNLILIFSLILGIKYLKILFLDILDRNKPY